MALLPGNILSGYVANSIHTVAKGTYSAGRLYDKFDRIAYAKIWFITEKVAIAEFLGFNEKLNELFQSLEPEIFFDSMDEIDVEQHSSKNHD